MAYDRDNSRGDWLSESALRNGITGDWPDPVPLSPPAPPPTPFPIDALLDLANAARSIHASTQAPLALCGASVLSAANYAAASVYDVELWNATRRPINLYIVSQGVSGERKSSADRLAMAGIEKWQRALQSDHIASKTEDTEVSGAGLPIAILSDATLQGIEVSLAYGLPTQMLNSDEAGRFLGGHGFKNEQIQETISGLSKLWDGSGYTRFLKGRTSRKGEATIIRNARLCLHILGQPVVLEPFIRNSLIQGQGIGARLLIHAPESTIGTRFQTVEQFAKSNESGDIAEFARLLNSILERAVSRDSESDTVVREILKLSEPAKAEYVHFQNDLEKRQGPDGDLKPFIELVNKMSEQAGRIAATLAAIHGEETISIDCMCAGIDIAGYFLNETVRLSSTLQEDDTIRKAEDLAKWLLAEDKNGSPRNGYKVSEITKHLRGSERTAHMRDIQLKILSDANWIKIAHKKIWVNPKLNIASLKE